MKYYITPPFKVDEFNIFGMEWYPDRIDLFINGKKHFLIQEFQMVPQGSNGLLINHFI